MLKKRKFLFFTYSYINLFTIFTAITSILIIKILEIYLDNFLYIAIIIVIYVLSTSYILRFLFKSKNHSG
jgi:hypothetical protein